MYKSESILTKTVCKKIGFNYGIAFVETMQRGGIIYVRGTAGHLDEFIGLRRACERAGYKYTGKIGV